MQPQSQLAAVFFADIEGYTSMMEVDQPGTLKLLEKYQKTVAERSAAHYGNVVKNYGDGCLILFSSSVDAVQSAIEIQKDLGSEPMVPLRIGISIGEVVAKDDDFYGNAINVAARLEKASAAGGVVVSEDVYKRLKSYPEYQFTNLGKYHFKNVNEDLFIYAINNNELPLPDKNELRRKFKGRKPIISLMSAAIILMVIAIAGYCYDRFFLTSEGPLERLIIAKFDNNTQDDELNIVGRMASDWIAQTISEEKIVAITSQETLENSARMSVGIGQILNMLDKQERSNILKGSYFKLNDSLVLSAGIWNKDQTKEIRRFEKVNCSINNPMIGIQELSSRIAGLLASTSNQEFTEQSSSDIPKYEAYKYYKLAILEWGDDWDLVLDYIHKSLEIDPEYLDVKFLLMYAYYNYPARRMYPQFDSLLTTLENAEVLYSEGEKDVLAFQRAKRDKNKRMVYENFKKIYDDRPTDLADNTTMLVHTVNSVNKPDEADDIYNKLDLTDFDFNQCAYCATREYIYARSLIDRGRPEMAATILEKIVSQTIRREVYLTLLRAYIRSNQWGKIDPLIDMASKNKALQRDWRYLYYQVSSDFRVGGHIDKSEEYIQKSIEAYASSQPLSHMMLARSYYEGYTVDSTYLDSAIYYFKKVRLERPGNNFVPARLATCEILKGNIEEGMQYLNEMDEMKDYDVNNNLYDTGRREYFRAQALSVLGQEDEAISLLKKALYNGIDYQTYNFHYDPHFANLLNHPEWEDVMTYWH